jgi:hypothetical protein
MEGAEGHISERGAAEGHLSERMGWGCGFFSGYFLSTFSV